MAKGKFISYLRVSTDKQGRGGLGLEAQRAAVESYLNGGRWTLAGEYVEAESGKRSAREGAGARHGHWCNCGGRQARPTDPQCRSVALTCGERCRPRVLRPSRTSQQELWDASC